MSAAVIIGTSWYGNASTKGELKTDIRELKVDFANLGTDITGVETDIAEVKVGLAEVKVELVEVKTDIHKLSNLVVKPPGFYPCKNCWSGEGGRAVCSRERASASARIAA